MINNLSGINDFSVVAVFVPISHAPQRQLWCTLVEEHCIKQYEVLQANERNQPEQTCCQGPLCTRPR